MANHWGGAMPGSPPGKCAYVRVESGQRVAHDDRAEAGHRGDQHQKYGPFLAGPGYALTSRLKKWSMTFISTPLAFRSPLLVGTLPSSNPHCLVA